MKKFLFTMTMLLAGFAYAGGSEVPWPLTSEEQVLLEELAGDWISKNDPAAPTYYHFYYEKVTNHVSNCQFAVALDEIDVATNTVIRSGSSSYCVEHPRKISFVMFDSLGKPSHILTFVGVRPEARVVVIGSANASLSASTAEEDVEQTMCSPVVSSQYIGLSLYNYNKTEERLHQELLFKFANPALITPKVTNTKTTKVHNVIEQVFSNLPPSLTNI